MGTELVIKISKVYYNFVCLEWNTESYDLKKSMVEFCLIWNFINNTIGIYNIEQINLFYPNDQIQNLFKHKNYVLSLFKTFLEDGLPLLRSITFIVSSKIYIGSGALACMFERKIQKTKPQNSCKTPLWFYWAVIAFHAVISNRRTEAKLVSLSLYLISSSGLSKLENDSWGVENPVFT